MKINQLTSTIAKIEGHKSQARISDIREIVSIIADLSYNDASVLPAIVKLGITRAKRKTKKKKADPNV